MRLTLSGVRKASTCAGLITYWPLGLFQSEAILARNLLGAIPADAVSPVASRICARIAWAVAVALGEAILGAVTSR